MVQLLLFKRQIKKQLITCHLFLCLPENKEDDFHKRQKKGRQRSGIELPNTFRSKTPKVKKDALKQRHHNQNTTSRKPKGQFISQILANGYP